MPVYLDIINNLGYKVVRHKIEGVIEKVLTEKGIAESVEVSLAIVDDNHMAGLHKKYMETEEITDVLSFPTEEGIGPDGIRHLGDIVVCRKYIQDDGQLEFLVEHGMRHLLGEHHE